MEQQIRFCKTSDGVRIAYATAHVQAAMVEFTDFLGFINQQLNTKGIPRTSVVSTIAQEVIPAFA